MAVRGIQLVAIKRKLYKYDEHNDFREMRFLPAGDRQPETDVR